MVLHCFVTYSVIEAYKEKCYKFNFTMIAKPKTCMQIQWQHFYY